MLRAAAGLARAGRFDEAIAVTQRAARLAPGEAAAPAAMAEHLFAAQRPHEALAAWDQALARAGAKPAFLCGKARVLMSLGRADEAAALFAAARSADPDLLEAPFGLARLAMEAGRLEEAQALAKSLIARAPGRPDFLWLAGRLALAGGEPGAAADLLARILADPALEPAQRAEVLLAMGEALDRLGRASEAFAAAIEGKAIQRRLFAERAAASEGETAKYIRLAAWFSSADRNAWAIAPPEGPGADRPSAHAFLVGFPRSGTTLLEQGLAGHRRVRTLEEAPTLAAHYAAFLSSDEGCARLARLTGEEADLWRARYWDEVRTHGIEPAGVVFVDKAPAGTLYLPLIARLFPRARILFALRDPRDVVLSCLRQAFQMNAMTYAFTSLEESAACYGACMAMAQIYRSVLPLDLVEARHEDLANDFGNEIRRISDFLELDFDPAMREIEATAAGRRLRTPSGAQVRLGVNREGVGRWLDYARELAPVLPILAPWVERFGYARGRA